MKFEIGGDVFKKAVDRVMAMIPNKAAIYDLECVRFVAENNKVQIIGFDTECYCNVTVPALVMEDGEAVVHKDDLKKVYTIKNNLLVVSEQEMFTVSNGKKKSTTKANIHYDVDDISIWIFARMAIIKFWKCRIASCWKFSQELMLIQRIAMIQIYL